MQNVVARRPIERSMMTVERAEGEDLRDPETPLSCLQVFALGGLEGRSRCWE
jgi:hypothetical protein